ncbi:hypothetical protein FRB98_001300, partial [Tulasnella sp. 332]
EQGHTFIGQGDFEEELSGPGVPGGYLLTVAITSVNKITGETLLRYVRAEHHSNAQFEPMEKDTSLRLNRRRLA